jgi:hypothetical protein
MLYNKHLSFNYFESEYYKITITNKDYLFYIYEKNNIIIIQRIDKDCGWSESIKLDIYIKYLFNVSSITLEPSLTNYSIIKMEDFPFPTDDKKIHYENDKYKIYSVSPDYNDIFQVNYNEESKKLEVTRLDLNQGWGQNLYLKYIEKKEENTFNATPEDLEQFLNTKDMIKFIHIGPSNNKQIILDIDINKIDYNRLNNYYESNNYILYIIENKYNDIFEIIFYEDNFTIYIKRLDKLKGWGQNLKLEVISKKDLERKIIYIGSSIHNEVYRMVDLKKRDCFVSLTTIPPRIKLPEFYKNIENFIQTQTYPIKNIFINICKKYKRFNETIDEDILNKLRGLDKVIINELDIDYGPASKYLGPLTKYSDILKDNLLIIIDDDRLYNKNLIRNFVIGYQSYPNIIFSTGLWTEYFDKNYINMDESFLEYQIKKEVNSLNSFYYGNGVGGFYGFCIKVEKLDEFIKYNFDILEKVKDSFFHDEGIILGYLKYKCSIILYIKHKGCNFISNEMVEALCTSGLCDRGKVENEILSITNNEFLLSNT